MEREAKERKRQINRDVVERKEERYISCRRKKEGERWRRENKHGESKEIRDRETNPDGWNESIMRQDS